MDNAKDKFRNVHEPLFHFVKSTAYYYDSDSIRKPPGHSKVVNGSVVSATGVSGVRYRHQIELSNALSADEKTAALSALAKMLDEVRDGKLSEPERPISLHSCWVASPLGLTSLPSTSKSPMKGAGFCYDKGR